MNPVILILMMIIIGAMIGGVTNSLAIKMLFRPYRAIYIGKYRLPFTPGLIPKRQQELARQLGKMVVEHLLTPEGLRRKLKAPIFQEQVTTWAQKEVENWLDHPATVKDLARNLDVELSSEKLEKSVSEWIEERYHTLMDEYRHVPLEEIISEEWRRKAEEGTDRLADHIQESILRYFRSREGRQKVTALIENYLDNQGFLGNMISSFMGPDGITERIYPAITRYIADNEMNVWLRGMLQSELKELMEHRVSFFEDKIGRQTIGRVLGQAVAKALPIEKWMTKTIAEWTRPHREKIVYSLIPLFITKMTELLSSRMDRMMETMHLSEIVQEEVEAFQVQRLEEMVLGISRREFKMITYLGALLGGLIGMLQGIIVLFFG
ncbi:DUF445 domain-containing protein [Halobacillus mangrovi]|uniref:DUF445 domain-containing protein n=1 Tax=Halobacillus mangrovi TaxID=402384 RepID=UPI003D957F5A